MERKVSEGLNLDSVNLSFVQVYPVRYDNVLSEKFSAHSSSLVLRSCINSYLGTGCSLAGRDLALSWTLRSL